MPRAFIIFVCLFALAAFPVQAQERLTSLTLDEALNLATRENFTLRAAQFDYQATRANEITAGLIPNPSFSYMGEQLNEPLTGQQATGPQYTVAIGQTFETGGKRQRRLDSARAATRVAGHTLTGVERQVLFQVKKSFTDALTAKAALELAEQNLKTIGEIEKLQSVRAAKGALSELELLRIQVQQYSFQRDATDARQAVQAAKNVLRTVAGPDVGDARTAADGAFAWNRLGGSKTIGGSYYRRSDLGHCADPHCTADLISLVLRGKRTLESRLSSNPRHLSRSPLRAEK